MDKSKTMYKLKTKFRGNIPETNSSSTHSIVISVDSTTFDPKTHNLEIIDDVAYINGNRYFGWEEEKYNDVLTKIQYVAGFLDERQLKTLTKALIKFTGVKDVVYRWQSDHDHSCPEIDHQSHDLKELIIENYNSIINFIFNTNSWLFTSNDNGGVDWRIQEEISGRNSNFKGKVTVHLPQTLGDIDYPFTSFPEDLSNFLYYDNSHQPINIVTNVHLVLDIVNSNLVAKFTGTHEYSNLNKESVNFKYFMSDNFLNLILIDSKYYIPFLSSEGWNILRNELKKSNNNKYNDRNYEFDKFASNIIKELIKSKNGYLCSISINYDEFKGINLNE